MQVKDMKPFKLNLKGGVRNDSPLHLAAELN